MLGLEPTKIGSGRNNNGGGRGRGKTRKWEKHGKIMRQCLIFCKQTRAKGRKLVQGKQQLHQGFEISLINNCSARKDYTILELVP